MRFLVLLLLVSMVAGCLEMESGEPASQGPASEGPATGQAGGSADDLAGGPDTVPVDFAGELFVGVCIPNPPAGNCMRFYASPLTPEGDISRDFTLPALLTGLDLELDWEPSSAVSETLRVRVLCMDGCEERPVATFEGAAPLVMQEEGLAVPAGSTVRVIVDAGNPLDPVGLVSQWGDGTAFRLSGALLHS